jgi:calcineurin-like phosphoesterase family protein
MKINFKDSPERKLFVTGCLHLNHNPSWETPLHKMRGYESSLEMTEDIISIINQTCKSSDVLLVLGDFCLNTSFEKFCSDVQRINPELWFVSGNHDSPWKKEFEKFCLAEYGFVLGDYRLGLWQDKIKVLGPYIETVWNKQFIVANHYAFQVWNGSHHGSWSLCSHSHGSLETILPSFANGKQLDCGWDVHKKPLSFEEIKEIMSKKSISMPDHHNKETT